MKIKGPLMSLFAQGSLGPRLTFSERPSGSQVRFQRKQKDITTSLRTIQREYFEDAVEKWNSLSDAEQKQWHDFVKQKG